MSSISAEWNVNGQRQSGWGIMLRGSERTSLLSYRHWSTQECLHMRTAQRSHKKSLTALNDNPPQSYGASPATSDHTVLPATRHRWTCPTLTPATQPSTRSTYPGGTEGWVDPKRHNKLPKETPTSTWGLVVLRPESVATSEALSWVPSSPVSHRRVPGSVSSPSETDAQTCHGSSTSLLTSGSRPERAVLCHTADHPTTQTHGPPTVNSAPPT